MPFPTLSGNELKNWDNKNAAQIASLLVLVNLYDLVGEGGGG
jgi:hypothetical protein